MADNESGAAKPSTSVSEGKVTKRVRKSSTSAQKKKEGTGASSQSHIPIFTDEFLALFRKQKGEIRSLKLTYSELSERLKLKYAEQEQIRLNNGRLRTDIDHLHDDDQRMTNKIKKIERQFRETLNYPHGDLLEFLREHEKDEQIRNKVQHVMSTSTYREIQRALKKRGLKANGSRETLAKRFKAALTEEPIRSPTSNTRFECLPNELFLMIFSYLSDEELLTSFCSLTRNGRFDALIRSRTSVDLRCLSRSHFIQLTCPHRRRRDRLIVPEQIRQLRLFNDDNTPGLINAFFSQFSFQLTHHFINLQLLVLDQPEQSDLMSLMPYLSGIRHLSIRLSSQVRMHQFVYTNLYASVLASSTCRLRSLTIVDDLDEPIRLPENLFLPDLRHLTLGSLTINDLQRLFRATPLLVHLKFHLNSDQYDSSPTYQPDNLKTNLTHLQLDGPHAEFSTIEMLLHQMPLLISLKLHCRGAKASQWQRLISERLPCLTEFRFKFDVRQRNLLISEFESDWWTKEKKWRVVGHPLSPSFYTLPLMDSKVILNARTAYRHENCVSSKLLNEYSDVRELTITLSPPSFQSCTSQDIYFGNVESLNLLDYKHSQKPIPHLVQLVNLISVRHLTIDSRMRAGTFLLLVKEMPRLESIEGPDAAFSAITNKFQNDKVNRFLGQRIQTLKIGSMNACDDLRYVSQLCIVFARIVHLSLNVKWAVDVWPWLSKMIDLRSATIYCRQGSFIDVINDPPNRQWFASCTYELRSQHDLRLWLK